MIYFSIFFCWSFIQNTYKTFWLALEKKKKQINKKCTHLSKSCIRRRIFVIYWTPKYRFIERLNTFFFLYVSQINFTRKIKYSILFDFFPLFEAYRIFQRNTKKQLDFWVRGSKHVSSLYPAIRLVSINLFSLGP